MLGSSGKNYNYYDLKMINIEEHYKTNFALGHKFTTLVKDFLIQNGVDAVQCPLSITRNPSEYKNYTVNEQDLIIFVPPYKYVGEVKSTKISFLNSKSYPYKDFIVDDYKDYDLKKEIPRWYFLISQKTKRILYINTVRSRQNWFRKTIFDKPKGRDIEKFMCPASELKDISEFVSSYRFYINGRNTL